MGVHRRFPTADRLAQQQALWSGVQQVLASHHVGDAHGVVVDGVGQQEGDRAIAARNDEVLQVGAFEADVAPDHVVELDGSSGRRGEAGHRVRTHGQGAITTKAVVAGRTTGGGVACVNRRTFAVAGVGPTLGQHPINRLAILIGALRLPGFVAAVVPVEPQPLQRVEHLLDQLRSGAFGVGVFDAHQELTARRAGKQPVEQGRAGRAQMQRAGGGGGETYAGGHPLKGSVARSQPLIAGSLRLGGGTADHHRSWWMTLVLSRRGPGLKSVPSV